MEKTKDTDPHRELRTEVLRRLGGEGAVLDRVLDYCENRFDPARLPAPPVLPLPDEPHLEAWRRYAAECGNDAFAYLQERLPQLAIPQRAGISKDPDYGAVARGGEPFSEERFGGRLALRNPQALQLWIHEHAAGALPVLFTEEREDFDKLVRALACRSEPDEIAPATNARMVAGFINWDRVHRLRESWTREHAEDDWASELQRVAREEGWRIRDRFMILRAAPYSGVDAGELGLETTAEAWRSTSTEIRLAHEFTHYTTKRLFDRMNVNLLDETICDWSGLVRAFGCFEADRYLRFLGLENAPAIRPSGRLHEYRADLDDEAFALVAALVVDAATGLERLTESHFRRGDEPRFLLALTRMTLELLACPEGDPIFRDALNEAADLL